MLNCKITKEIWKDTVEFPDRFEVSNLGNIRNKKTKVLKKQVNSGSSKGYKAIIVSVNNKATNHSVHRMVAKAFIPNPEGKPQVNHKNSIRDDNRVENLEWVTVSENIQHAMKHGAMNHSAVKGVKKSNAQSRFHNVCWREDKKRWVTTTKLNGKRLSQRLFKLEEDAAKWADELLRMHNITDRPFNFT